MKVVIAGGTGFLGRPLAARFAADGHEVVILTRHTASDQAPPGTRLATWTPTGEAGSWAEEIEGARVVVNLAGESIAARRWSDAHKHRILESRVQATRSLAAAIRRARRSPTVFISGSAVGYYGPLRDETVEEDHPPGSDFLARVSVQWEAEATGAAGAETRVVCVRTGLVLEKDGGALPQMLPPFRLGVGGPVGSGRQYWPWIHRADWVDIVRWAVETPAVTGPINATGPAPVTNAEFARALGRTLHRPAFMPAPAFALRILLGEMADALLLSGQRAVPATATRLGYRFRYSRVEDALAAIFTKAPAEGSSRDRSTR
jgi:uncharacterized protein (TIGR01777 family)